MNNKRSTKELISLLNMNRNKIFEAALDNGYFRATHFLFCKNNLINDTGIDSQVVLWKSDEFFEHYKEAHWQIDQIVNIG